MNQRGLLLTFLGWVHKATTQKDKRVFFHFSLQAYTFYGSFQWLDKLFTIPIEQYFHRLKPKKLSFGMLLWHLFRILNLDSVWPLRLNYISHDAPCIAFFFFLEHTKKVFLVFHGKYLTPYRKMLAWNNKAYSKKFKIFFVLFLLFRCSAFWQNIQGFCKNKSKVLTHFQSKTE